MPGPPFRSTMGGPSPAVTVHRRAPSRIEMNASIVPRIFFFDACPDGKPASTFPGHALTANPRAPEVKMEVIAVRRVVIGTEHGVKETAAAFMGGGEKAAFGVVRAPVPKH